MATLIPKANAIYTLEAFRVAVIRAQESEG